MADESVDSSTDIKDNNDSTEITQPKSGESEIDKSALSYEDGKCFYTDPSSGTVYEWSDEKQQWIPKQPSDKDYEYDGETYYYTDKNTNVKYKWDKDKNEWAICPTEKKTATKGNDDDEEEEEMDSDEENVKEKKIIRQDMSSGTYNTDGNNLTYTDAKDGTVFFWDREKSAWFPKIDDDFLAHYQMSYGFIDPEQKDEKKTAVPEPKKQVEVKSKKPEEKPQEAVKRKIEEPTWFDVSDETNNKVYVSNLPLDITEEEFVTVMQKCGVIMKDPDTGKMKVKLYMEPGTNYLKGDALCTYIKVESVGLALTVLDGYEYRNKKLKVERAKFTMKGSSYNPSLKPKKKKKKELEKAKKLQERIFDWRPEKTADERGKHERVVIVKNLFDPSDFDKDVGLILEYKEDLHEECKKCGDVRKITLYDRHPEGVAQITFREFEGAEACVQLLCGRWFGKRKISAHIWDGKTKYKIAETVAEITERQKKWDNYLDNDEERESNTDNKPKEESESTKKTTEEDRDSNGTRSSAGSGDDTAEE